MNPAESLAYLSGLGLELRPGRKFDLTAITTLLKELGEPQRAFASLHIAGTNGKGSVAALSEAAARAAGLRTGLYTSPHLERLSERIRIRGEEISPTALALAATTVRSAVERLLASGALAQPPAFFEVVTAAAFVAFAAAGLDLAVVEVGMGGRLDATNVISAKVAAITPIGMDHELYLGSTLEAIAGEKAGIIKPGLRAVVSAHQKPEAEAVLRRRAEAAAVPLIQAPPATSVIALPDGHFQIRLPYLGSDLDIASPLRGRHQVENAAVAAAACEQLHDSGFAIPPAALAAGFAGVQWPGRLEQIATEPEIFLDGAHNPMAARALAEFLDLYSATHPAPVLIYGCMRDKAVEEVCELLFPRARAVVLTAAHHARALAPESLAEACGPLAPQVEVAPTYPAALAIARRWSGAVSPSAPIFVTGSLYLVGEAREYARRP